MSECRPRGLEGPGRERETGEVGAFVYYTRRSVHAPEKEALSFFLQHTALLVCYFLLLIEGQEILPFPIPPLQMEVCGA